jgi:hypothetical protein
MWLMTKYDGSSRIYYRAKPNTWFDEGTLVSLIDDYSDTQAICGKHNKACGWGLFEGIKDGKLDEEVCSFCEFELAAVINDVKILKAEFD